VCSTSSRFVFALTLVSCGARSEIRQGGATIDASSPVDASTDAPPSDAQPPPPVDAQPPPPPLDAQPPDPTPDLVWYRLDETTGTTAHDSTSHHYDVTNLGGVAWGDGATFDGATCGEVNVDPRFRVPPITMTAWLTPVVRSDESINDYALAPFPPNAVSGDVPGLGGYALGLDVWTDGGGGAALAVEAGIDANVSYHSLDGPFASGVRHFAAVVMNASNATVWVDGAFFQTVSADVAPSSQPVPLHLGCHNDDGGYGSKRFYRGGMRDVRVYTSALDASVIASLYAHGPV